jgi:hypothetical protein
VRLDRDASRAAGFADDDSGNPLVTKAYLDDLGGSPGHAVSAHERSLTVLFALMVLFAGVAGPGSISAGRRSVLISAVRRGVWDAM